MNKAEVYQRRCGNAFNNANISSYTKFLTSEVVLKDLTSDMYYHRGKPNYIPIIVRAVDNAETRNYLNNYFIYNTSKDAIYIDASNNEWSGQVVIGVKKDKKVLLASMGSVYPELLEIKEDDKISRPSTCQKL